eukprot:6172274-Pleurochrysis_carterae.AAC.5
MAKSCGPQGARDRLLSLFASCACEAASLGCAASWRWRSHAVRRERATGCFRFLPLARVAFECTRRTRACGAVLAL